MRTTNPSSQTSSDDENDELGDDIQTYLLYMPRWDAPRADERRHLGGRAGSSNGDFGMDVRRGGGANRTTRADARQGARSSPLHPDPETNGRAAARRPSGDASVMPTRQFCVVVVTVCSASVRVLCARSIVLTPPSPLHLIAPRRRPPRARSARARSPPLPSHQTLNPVKDGAFTLVADGRSYVLRPQRQDVVKLARMLGEVQSTIIFKTRNTRNEARSARGANNKIK